ncbi:hypothetical protein Zm00014a_000909 [Zea mays]|uniref:Uncharacterized protein n=1 Tax=Zea mays TaxID=4577 RepID=A0A317Y2C8_MAIZE|nr:hypothetical protein Zm00014a_000909 [Zea mays]
MSQPIQPKKLKLIKRGGQFTCILTASPEYTNTFKSGA